MTGPATYVRRPVPRQAILFTRDTWPQVNDWLHDQIGPEAYHFTISGRRMRLAIDTTEGPRDCPAGYWLVQDSRGGIYPVHPQEFDDGYQAATGDPDRVVVPLRSRT